MLYNYNDVVCASKALGGSGVEIKDYLKDKFEYKSCRILGFARSNKPLVEMLLRAGARVTVHDKDESIKGGAEYKAYTEQGARFILGEDYLSGGLDADYIFRSPGFRPDLPEIREAVQKGATLSSEMELFFDICPCVIIGITGSDGKTTTTTLTHLFLEEEFKGTSRRAYVGGNIGAPLLPLAEKMNKNDVAVVELSSFQLETMHRSPSRALITNITPNHLNWHTDMDEYIAAKNNICRYAGVEMLVANAENEITSKIADKGDLPVTYFSSVKTSYAETVPPSKANCKAIYEREGVIILDDGETATEILKTSDILLPGRHNVENYMSAIALTQGLVSRETVQRIAKTFKGVEHRLEFVRELNGVKYYNSSIDSSPTRTAAALRALSKAPIIICGGSEKGVTFDTLAIDLCTLTKAVVLTGQSAQNILSEIEKCPLYDSAKLTVKHIPDFDEAVKIAASLAGEGDIVLLSPACASFDCFKDFAHRGNHFKEIVNNLK